MLVNVHSVVLCALANGLMQVLCVGEWTYEGTVRC